MVTWSSDGQTFIGTEEQRAAVKQVSLKDVPMDPQPELRGDPEETLEETKKKRNSAWKKRSGRIGSSRHMVHQ